MNPRTWKQWWWFVRYWLRCLAKDIERAKHEWEDQVEGEFWRMMYGPRMMITYHKSPGESVASRMTSQRVMPLEDIYDFFIGSWKKVFFKPKPKKPVKGNPYLLNLRQVIADNGMKDVMNEQDQELLRSITVEKDH